MFEVQTRMGDTWENCWADEHDQPIYFGDYITAEIAIYELLLEIQQAVEDGQMTEPYHRDDYRIIRIH